MFNYILHLWFLLQITPYYQNENIGNSEKLINPLFNMFKNHSFIYSILNKGKNVNISEYEVFEILTSY